MPLALVENSGRCKTNENGAKVCLFHDVFDLHLVVAKLIDFLLRMSYNCVQILPDGTPWIPNLMKEITIVVSNGSKSIHVDQKLIDGPNPNNRWKKYIPLILAVQVSSSHDNNCKVPA